MSWALLLQIFTAVGGLAGISAFINALINRKKVNSEANNTDVKSTETLFNMTRQQLTDMQERLEKQDAKIDLLEAENINLQTDLNHMRGALWEQEHWISRVYIILTPDQKQIVGEPPRIKTEKK